MRSTTGIGTGARAPHPPQSSASGTAIARTCRAIAFVLVGIFLVSIARYYHPGTGFTALIGFPAEHGYEAPALRTIPHFDYAGAGIYDGQFYAQRALDPLARDPQVDRAMDLAPFRARRILFSWTAYIAGFGRPSWILEAYALQNVVAWLALAIVMSRWLPPRSPRGLAAWTAVMFSHGLLWSARAALLDGPSLLLTAVAIALAEKGHPLGSAALAGVNGLGRETNVLGVLAQPVPRTARAFVRLLAAAVVVALPILIWEDYLRSIYRSTIFSGAQGQVTVPAVAMSATVIRVLGQVRSAGMLSAAGLDFCIVVPLILQAIFLLCRPRIQSPWWRVAVGYVVLMLLLDRVLWDPATAAITRVTLPMTAGFNVLLPFEARGGRFWTWFAAGNLHLIPALWVL